MKSILLLSIILFNYSCTGGGFKVYPKPNPDLVSPAPEENTSSLSIKLTDAPFDMDILSRVEVSFSKVEMYHNDKYKLLIEKDMTFDILKLRGGLTETLVGIDIEPGVISELRLFVVDAKVYMKNGKVYDMKVPSGAQTGLKLFLEPSLTVKQGLSYELTLDFDISRSFVPLGNPNSAKGITGFNFKPTIRVANNTTQGRITGRVYSDMCSILSEDKESLNMQAIDLYLGDTVVASAGTNENGDFSIIGLEAGSYQLKIGSNKHTEHIQNINVTVGNETTVEDILLEGKCTTINGLVRSSNGTESLEDDYLLDGAKLELYDENDLLIETVFSDIDGKYSFGKNFTGVYTVKIYKEDHTELIKDLELVDILEYNDEALLDLVVSQEENNG